MTTVHGWLLNHWQGVGVALLVSAVVGSGYGWMSERDTRIRAEGAREVAVAQAEESAARAAAVDSAYRAVVAETEPLIADLDSMRAAAEAARATAEAGVRRAEVEVATAGDSLRATLDNLSAVAPPELAPLVHTAQRQHREEQAAHSRVSRAFRAQIDAMTAQLSAADSTASLWQTRHTRLEQAYDARGDALERAEAALETTQEAGQGWSTLHKITAGVALLGVGWAAGGGL